MLQNTGRNSINGNTDTRSRKKRLDVLFSESLIIALILFNFSNGIKFLQLLWFLFKSNFSYFARYIEIIYETNERGCNKKKADLICF